MQTLRYLLLVIQISLISVVSIYATEVDPIFELKGGNLYCYHVTPGNWEEVRSEIYSFYDAANPDGLCGPGEEVPCADEAIDDMLVSLMDDLFLDVDFDHEGCDGGFPFQDGVLNGVTEPDSNGVSIVYSVVNFTWPNYEESSAVEGYVATYLDFRTGESGDQGSRSPFLSLTVPGETDKKAIALNARCLDTEGSYTIVIIEEDVNLSEMPHPDDVGGEDAGPPTQPRLSEEPESDTLIVYPNPVDGNQVSVIYELQYDNIISLELYDAATGQQVKTIISEQEMEFGRHQNDIDISALSSGIYYITLRKKDKVIYKKLVVM